MELRYPILVASLVWTIAFGLAPGIAGAQSSARSRPFYVSGGLGPAALFAHEYGDCCDAHFRTEGEFGWHPSGNDTGFFLAANATFTLGRHWFLFFPGVRLGGDIEVFANRDLAVLLSPSGLGGGGLFDPDGPVDSLGFFVLQAAFAAKLALLERVLQVWLRPVAIDFLFFPSWYDNDFEFDAVYSFVGGVAFTF